MTTKERNLPRVLRPAQLRLVVGCLCFGVFAAATDLGAQPQPEIEPFWHGKTETPDRERLRVDPLHPFYLRLGDRCLLLFGASDRAALAIWQNAKGFEWRRHLDDLAENGFNYVRQDVTAWTGLADFRRYAAQFSRPRWAFARTGPGVAVDGQPRFDLTRFDEGYFTERLIPFLREAERRGLVVELTLFDGCRNRRRRVPPMTR